MQYLSLFIFLISSTFSFFALAAPHPATSSSMMISPNSGLFYSRYGFKIDAGKTGWLHVKAPEGSRYIETMYKSPSFNFGVQAALTVRVDPLEESGKLKSYVNKWMKDYHRFGFDVLTAKPVKVKNRVGFLVDLVNRDTRKQLRQIVFIKKKVAVILTCRDHESTFKQTLPTCNRIFSRFDWTI